MNEAFMIIGFLIAAYAIVGNDSIQTLGTFLYSNSHRPWWVLWLFSSTVMVSVILFGWFNYNQDPSYSRLNKVYDKSVSLAEVLESIELAREVVRAEPEQSEILAELDLLEAQIKETKSVFTKDPRALDASLDELIGELGKLEALSQSPLVPNPQRVTVRAVVTKTQALLERIEERRDVSNFISWKYLLPPIALLILTRFGFPVSTSFLVLITFQPAVLSSMMIKSLSGYVVAMLAALAIYLLVVKSLESRWRREGEDGIKPIWVGLQWCSTAFLWSMWLVQDMANIFVYLPRMPGAGWLAFAIVWMVMVQAFIYYTHGGKIQQVVTSKTNTHDIRSATIVDLLYGLVLYIFKVQSNVPMSTTWVFLGLLAGREIAFALSHAGTLKHAFKLARKDMVKAGFGLGVSVVIAYFINLV
jgi:hypothetical protein